MHFVNILERQGLVRLLSHFGILDVFKTMLLGSYFSATMIYTANPKIAL